MLSTALEMAKNQGLDSVCQNKKNKNKKFREKAAEGHVGVYGDAPIPKRRPFPAFRSSTNTDLFVTYRGKADRRADRHHQRPPRASHWRPTGDRLATSDGRPTGDTTDTADRLAARLAAVPVTSDHQQRTSDKDHQRQHKASDKDGPRRQGPRPAARTDTDHGPAARTGRKGIIYNNANNYI